jgi:hypothetical protein
MKLKLGSTGMTVGFFVALMHAVWMLMIFLGLGQLYLDWIFGLHLISNPFTVQPFNFGSGLTLIVFTFVVGYVMGWAFAFIWNKLHKGK